MPAVPAAPAAAAPRPAPVSAAEADAHAALAAVICGEEAIVAPGASA